jgi:uncharacterized UPF0160 family protein
VITAGEIYEFRRRLENDPENHEARRSFHENYEWLEGYWRSQFGKNYFDKVWKTNGEFYWQNVQPLREIAASLAVLPPVGDNEKEDYEANEEVAAAKELLRTLNKTPDRHFRALMIVVRQIRNNMFHGKKMEIIEEDQYQRNKTLIRYAAQITNLLLENLADAEANQ